MMTDTFTMNDMEDENNDSTRDTGFSKDNINDLNQPTKDYDKDPNDNPRSDDNGNLKETVKDKINDFKS